MTTTAATVATLPRKGERKERELTVREWVAATEASDEDLTADEAEATEDVSRE